MDTLEEIEYDLGMLSTFFERAIDDYLEGNPDVKNQFSFIDDSFFPPMLTQIPPKNDKEQIERISLVIRAAKYLNELTADEIAKNLTGEHKMGRAALNAYIYGTIKTPPTREFMFALFKALRIPDESINTGLEMCWYKGANVELKKVHFVKSLLFEIAKEKGKQLSSELVEKLTMRLTSIAELFIDEETKGIKEGNKNEK